MSWPQNDDFEGDNIEVAADEDEGIAYRYTQNGGYIIIRDNYIVIRHNDDDNDRIIIQNGDMDIESNGGNIRIQTSGNRFIQVNWNSDRIRVRYESSYIDITNNGIYLNGPNGTLNIT